MLREELLKSKCGDKSQQIFITLRRSNCYLRTTAFQKTKFVADIIRECIERWVADASLLDTVDDGTPFLVVKFWSIPPHESFINTLPPAKLKWLHFTATEQRCGDAFKRRNINVCLNARALEFFLDEQRIHCKVGLPRNKNSIQCLEDHARVVWRLLSTPFIFK